MIFKTSYDRERIFSNPGSRFENIYKMKINKDTGKKELMLTSERDNIYEYIQSFAESTDIHTILAKFKNGDISVLNKSNGFFADITNMPNNLADAHEILLNAENSFNELPLETRAKFDFSYDKFISTMDTPFWFESMGFNNIKKANEIINDEKGEVNDEER